MVKSKCLRGYRNVDLWRKSPLCDFFGNLIVQQAFLIVKIQSVASLEKSLKFIVLGVGEPLLCYVEKFLFEFKADKVSAGIDSRHAR